MPHLHNNVLLADRKLIFMFVPKTGTTSIKAAILRTYGYRVPDEKETLPGTELKLLHNHPVFNWLSNEDIWHGYRDHTIVAFVRDPITRLISFYKDKGDYFNNVKSLNDFIFYVTKTDDLTADPHLKSQCFLLASMIDRTKLLPNLIGRFETINYGWTLLAKRFDLAPLPHLNVTVNAEFEISDEAQQKIIQRYAYDYLYFDFSTSNGKNSQRGGIVMSRPHKSPILEYDGFSSESDSRRF
jgi:hypothetical protein